jgi:hypothetical protein
MMIYMLIYMTGSHIQKMCTVCGYLSKELLSGTTYEQCVYKYWHQYESVKKEHLVGGSMTEEGKARWGKENKNEMLFSFWN